MKRQQHPDIQRPGLLQHRLHLRAVLAHDVGVVPPRLVQIVPVEVHLIGKQRPVQCAEAAEGVRRQQQLVRLVVGHHHLRPVDHGRRHKAQGMPAGAEGIPLLDDGDAPRHLRAEELPHHGLGHGAAHELRLGIVLGQIRQLRRVIRLHVVYHDVVQLPSCQRVGQILPERAAHHAVHAVEQHGLLVRQQVAVEADTVRHAEHTFKQRQTPAVGADPCIIIIDFSRTIHIFIILSTAYAGEFVSYDTQYRIIAKPLAFFHCFLRRG